MSDQPEITGAEENFAEMLDAFSPGKRSEVRVGDRVKGSTRSSSAPSCWMPNRTSPAPWTTSSSSMSPP